MRLVTACLTVIALAAALPAQAEDAPASSLAIIGVTVIDATGAPARPELDRMLANVEASNQRK